MFFDGVIKTSLSPPPPLLTTLLRLLPALLVLFKAPLFQIRSMWLLLMQLLLLRLFLQSHSTVHKLTDEPVDVGRKTATVLHVKPEKMDPSLLMRLLPPRLSSSPLLLLLHFLLLLRVHEGAAAAADDDEFDKVVDSHVKKFALFNL